MRSGHAQAQVQPTQPRAEDRQDEHVLLVVAEQTDVAQAHGKGCCVGQDAPNLRSRLLHYQAVLASDVRLLLDAFVSERVFGHVQLCPANQRIGLVGRQVNLS